MAFNPSPIALNVRECWADYGGAPVVRGLNLSLEAGQVMGLLGRNGSGRSTLVKVISGQLGYSGLVQHFGQSVAGKPPHQIAKEGLAVVLQNRDIFPTLTVAENLRLGQKHRAPARAGNAGLTAPAWTQERLLDLFPVLARRRDALGGTLSGGEQQLLALARALMGQPQLLVVDEASEGLSPVVFEPLIACLKEVAQSGCAILLIEQRLSLVRALAQRVGVIGDGKLQYLGPTDELDAQKPLIRRWLGLDTL